MDDDTYSVPVDLVKSAADVRAAARDFIPALRQATNRSTVSRAIVACLQRLQQACTAVSLPYSEDRLVAYIRRVQDWSDDTFRPEGLAAAAGVFERPMISLGVAHKNALSFVLGVGEVIEALSKVLDLTGHGGGSFLRQWAKYTQTSMVRSWVRDAVQSESQELAPGGLFAQLAAEGVLLEGKQAVLDLKSSQDMAVSRFRLFDYAFIDAQKGTDFNSTGVLWVAFPPGTTQEKAQAERTVLLVNFMPSLAGSAVHHLKGEAVQDEADTRQPWYKPMQDYLAKVDAFVSALSYTATEVFQSPTTGRWGFKIQISTPPNKWPKQPKIMDTVKGWQYYKQPWAKG